MDMYDLTTGFEEDPSYLGLQPRVLKRTLSKPKSAGGAVTDTVQSQPVLPNAIDQYRSRAANAYQQGLEMMNREPDMTALQEYAKERSKSGEAAMLNALAAQYAGESFQPVQAQFLKRAAAARDPMKAGSGFITPDGQYIQDPSEGQGKRAEFLLNMARQYETLAQTAETAQERIEAQRAQNEINQQLRLLGLNIQQQGLNLRAANAGGPGRAPAAYQWTTTEDGQAALKFIPGGPADPATKSQGTPSEDERKAAGWFFQADNAIRNMQQVLKRNPDASKARVPERLAGVVPVFGADFANSLRPADRQQYMQAAESMSEALLRASTGAAITAAETDQKLRELIPQIGDGPEVIKQKLDSYQVYMQALQARANRALPADMRGGPGAAPAANNDPLGLRGR